MNKIKVNDCFRINKHNFVRVDKVVPFTFTQIIVQDLTNQSYKHITISYNIIIPHTEFISKVTSKEYQKIDSSLFNSLETMVKNTLTQLNNLMN